ncbi:MAG TPA: hypothetical protein VF796_21495, partial [Humisphaera sp.]
APAPAGAAVTAPTSRPLVEPGGRLYVEGVLDRLEGGPAALGFTVADLTDLAKRPNAPAGLLEALSWLGRNERALVEGAKPSPLPKQPWGRVTYVPSAAGRPATLYLITFVNHASGKLIAYGLSGENVKRAYKLDDGKQADLKLEKTPRDLIIEVTPKGAAAARVDPIATVVAVELDGEPRTAPLAVAPAADGSYLLHARDAVVTGVNLRYEPEAIKNTLGYWTNPQDGADWVVRVDKPGTYEVEALQGCGKNSGGSLVEFTVAGQTLPMTVQDTGHFQNFVPRVLGKVKLDAGTHALSVRVRQKKGAAVMDLRQVTLKPVAG